jgi:hypothetical protein
MKLRTSTMVLALAILMGCTPSYAPAGVHPPAFSVEKTLTDDTQGALNITFGRPKQYVTLATVDDIAKCVLTVSGGALKVPVVKSVNKKDFTNAWEAEGCFINLPVGTITIKAEVFDASGKSLGSNQEVIEIVAKQIAQAAMIIKLTSNPTSPTGGLAADIGFENGDVQPSPQALDAPCACPTTTIVVTPVTPKPTVKSTVTSTPTHTILATI